MTNKTRSDLVERIFIEDMDLDQLDPETATSDLLADIRHYCDAHHLAFHKCDRRAYEHYIEERRDKDLGLEVEE